MRQRQSASGGEAARMLRDHIKNGTFRDLYRDWKWILSFAKDHWGSIVLYTLFGMGSSALSLVSSVVSKYLIDCITSLDLDRLIRLIPLLILSAALGVGFSALNSRFSAKLGVTMQNHVQSTIFDRLIHSQWLGISKYSSGDLLNRFSADVSTVSGCAVSLLPSLIIQLFSIVATLAVILYYDPMMALIGCASTPLLFLLSHQLLKKQREHNRTMRQISSELSSFQSETFRNIDTLKSFGIEDHVSGQLHSHQSKYRDAVLEFNRFNIQTQALLSSVSTLVQYIALGYCLCQLWNRNIVLGTMVFFLQQRSTLQSAFSGLISLVPKALSGSVAAERLRELTELPPEERDPSATEAPSPLCTIRVENAGISYDPDRPVLRDVNLHAGPGEVVALIGPSGQGKTTLLRLLLGLISPVSGSAALEIPEKGSVPLSPSTRHYFSYVPQGNTLLAGTVAENLRMIDPEATDEQIIRALKSACAWEFVEKLPNTIHSRLGEGGKGVSEGQAQRIAIARALMRKAPILLLDEVTSALDMATEERVLKNLMDLGLTCIVTTHRPSVLSMCTRVYRVEAGEVAQLSRKEIEHITVKVQ